jgi:hypothetical protein
MRREVHGIKHDLRMIANAIRKQNSSVHVPSIKSA